MIGLPLFWRVFAANASVLLLAFCGLVFAPITVSVPVGAGELAILAAGLVALLAANVVFLRPAFAPLEELAETMRHHDPLSARRPRRRDRGPERRGPGADVQRHARPARSRAP